uniref:Uncharacterized protein n=1 Tax=Timema cristinae TaxID=61476 RepID=A0A7R9GX47_TIMCR|nr:unnamed protein product [Timema cristinae]
MMQETSAARRRPPPIHDISIDVDEDREVDVREHDWRFQFKHHSEEEEDGADTQPEVASARLQTTQTRSALTLEQEMAAFASVIATACSSSNVWTTYKQNARLEAQGLESKFHNFEIAFLSVFWNDILERVDKGSNSLQKQTLNLVASTEQLQTSEESEFDMCFRVVGDDGFITTVTTVTQQRESPDNSDLQELLDKLAQEKH